LFNLKTVATAIEKKIENNFKNSQKKGTPGKAENE